MARIRNLKPEFFTDAEMLALSPLHRLFFQGLWCYADREGRLEDRPGDLKVRILPGDDCNPEQLMADLERAGRIRRYAVAGQRLAVIINFSKHQRCHKDEKPSKLPPPPEKQRQSFDAAVETMRSAGKNPQAPVEAPLGAGNLGALRPETETGAGDGDGDGIRRRKPEPPSASLPPAGRPPLRDEMDAVFFEAAGVPYEWTRADEDAVRGLLGKTGGRDEILRRWRIAQGTRFPKCTGVACLLQHWNAYSREDTGPPRADVTRGIARVSNGENRVVDDEGTVEW